MISVLRWLLAMSRGVDGAVCDLPRSFRSAPRSNSDRCRTHSTHLSLRQRTANSEAIVECLVCNHVGWHSMNDSFPKVSREGHR